MRHPGRDVVLKLSELRLEAGVPHLRVLQRCVRLLQPARVPVAASHHSWRRLALLTLGRLWFWFWLWLWGGRRGTLHRRLVRKLGLTPGRRALPPRPLPPDPVNGRLLLRQAQGSAQHVLLLAWVLRRRQGVSPPLEHSAQAKDQPPPPGESGPRKRAEARTRHAAHSMTSWFSCMLRLVIIVLNAAAAVRG